MLINVSGNELKGGEIVYNQKEHKGHNFFTMTSGIYFENTRYYKTLTTRAYYTFSKVNNLYEKFVKEHKTIFPNGDGTYRHNPDQLHWSWGSDKCKKEFVFKITIA